MIIPNPSSNDENIFMAISPPFQAFENSSGTKRFQLSLRSGTNLARAGNAGVTRKLTSRDKTGAAAPRLPGPERFERSEAVVRQRTDQPQIA
jgi:hypothetical protein